MTVPCVERLIEITSITYRHKLSIYIGNAKNSPFIPLCPPLLLEKIDFKQKVSNVTSKTLFCLKSIFFIVNGGWRVDEGCMCSTPLYIYHIYNLKFFSIQILSMTPKNNFFGYGMSSYIRILLNMFNYPRVQLSQLQFDTIHSMFKLFHVFIVLTVRKASLFKIISWNLYTHKVLFWCIFYFYIYK